MQYGEMRDQIYSVSEVENKIYYKHHCSPIEPVVYLRGTLGDGPKDHYSPIEPVVYLRGDIGRWPQRFSGCYLNVVSKGA